MKSVVIADDEPIMRYDITLILQDMGFSVVGEAADGFDASKLLPTIEVAYAQGQRLRKLNQEVSSSRMRLEESRVIEHAKSLYALEHGISELEAHPELQRFAMDKRSTVFLWQKQLCSAIHIVLS